MPQDMEIQMLGTYPRNWTEAQVQEWIAASAADQLSDKVARFVLPRVLDGLVRGEAISPDGIERTLERFSAGDPSAWSEREWHFLDRFQRVFLQVAQDLGVSRLDTALCLFVRGGWSAEDLFAQVLEWPDERLIPLLHANSVQDAEHGISRFWPDPSVPKAFFDSSALKTRLLNAGKT